MNIFHKVLELWPGHESGTYGRTDGWTDGRTDMTYRLIVMYAPVKFHEHIP